MVFVGPGKLEDAEQSHKAHLTGQNLVPGEQKPLTRVDGLSLAALS